MNYCITSYEKKDDKLVKYLKKKKLSIQEEMKEMFLRDFINALKKSKEDWIVRITADCPMIDPVIVDKKFH